MKVKAVNESEKDLATYVERIVSSRTSGAIRDLQVSVVSDSEIVLSGRATTYYAKQLATHAAMSAGENISISNDIQVK